VSANLWAVFLASFLASTVEFVEAFTIVLVIGVTINWKSAFAGTGIAIAALAVVVTVLGSALLRLVSLDSLRLVVGVLLVLFGLKWLKKSIMRYAGLRATHDEEAIYEEHLTKARAREETRSNRINPFGVVTSFKSVLLEGLEVAFIVIGFGLQAGTNGMEISSLGAVGALVIVVVAGSLIRAPLQRVPENTLKFVVGIMLTTFGTFWGGEGVGVSWWGKELFLFALVGFFLLLSGILISWIRLITPRPRVQRVR
jgi:uncharacterized membrane protein